MNKEEHRKYLETLPPGVKEDMLKGGKTLDHSPLFAALSLTGGGKVISKARSALKISKDWFNRGRTPGEDKTSWRDLAINDWKQRGKPGDGTKGGWDPTRGFRPGVKASEGGFGSGPTPLFRQLIERKSPLLPGLSKLKLKKNE